MPKNVSVPLAMAAQANISRFDDDLQEVRKQYQAFMSSTKLPTEPEILAVLTHLEVLTDSLVSPEPKEAGDAASALLSINGPQAPKRDSKVQKISPEMRKYRDELSKMAYNVMELPNVFISPNVLKQYVEIQSKLRNPSYIPSVFELYANKPQPQEGSEPIKYVTPNSNKPISAIPPPIADHALAAAIDAKEFDAATAIVEASYAKRAFRLNKILRKASLPVTALVGGPMAAYVVAEKLSVYDTVSDPQLAINMTWIGIMAYVGFTSIIGLVALTTANDQMIRVTWAVGTPLRYRWLREEERAAMDKIAVAWGFREPSRRGEEEGSEWDTLRDWIGD